MYNRLPENKKHEVKPSIFVAHFLLLYSYRGSSSSPKSPCNQNIKHQITANTNQLPKIIEKNVM